MNDKLKRSLLVIGVISFTAGIVWSVKSTSTVQDEDPVVLIESGKQDKTAKEPFWSQVIPSSTQEGLDEATSIDTLLLEKKIDDALGLGVAIISVSMERPSEQEFSIPWRDNKRAVVRVTLPSTWITQRSKQLGSKEIALNSLRSIIDSVAPESTTTFHIVQSELVVPFQVPTSESYAKHIAVTVGLCVLLISGFVVDRRRRPFPEMVVQHVENPHEEAERILGMEHIEARQAIDSLQDHNKIKVLQAIVSQDAVHEETPVVHVQRQQELTTRG